MNKIIISSDLDKGETAVESNICGTEYSSVMGALTSMLDAVLQVASKIFDEDKEEDRAQVGAILSDVFVSKLTEYGLEGQVRVIKTTSKEMADAMVAASQVVAEGGCATIKATAGKITDNKENEND